MTKLLYPGLGIEILNFPTCEMTIDGGAPLQMITPEAQKKVDTLMRQIRDGRGKFIAGCVDIENVLGQAISYYFFKDDSLKREMLHDFILDTTIFSFSQKKKVLQRIMEKYPKEFNSFTSKSRQEMFDNLNYLIKMRNAFAHGSSIIDFQADKVYFRYYSSTTNQQTELIVSSNFFIDLQKMVLDTIMALMIMTPQLNWNTMRFSLD